MQNIIIDDEFKSLLPVLGEETKASLEANLIENGCRDALVLWNGILIDGHNRYEICTRNNIPFSTINKEFPGRDEALLWIIATQVSRRNMSQTQLRYYRGIHYRTEKKIQGINNQYFQKSEKGHNVTFQTETENTAEKLGKQYHVAGRTILRDAKAAEAVDAIGEVSPAAKQMILSDEAYITKKALEELSFRPKEEIEAVAMKIEEGTYEKKKPASGAPKAQESPADSVTVNMRTLDIAISKISDEIDSKLLKIIESGGGPELKAALSLRIDRLGDLYERLLQRL